MARQCENPRDDGSWCGVPIVWDNEARRYREADTNEIHQCQWYKNRVKKQQSNYQKTIKVPEDVKQEFARIEQEVKQAPVKDYSNNDIMNAVSTNSIEILKRLSTIERLLSEYGNAMAKMSFEKASSLK